MTKTEKIRGFTIIELMVTVGIISILAALAYPSYRTHVITSKLTEAINAATDCKLAVETFYFKHRRYPDRDEIGCSEKDVDNLGKHIEKIDTHTTGLIVVLVRNIDPDFDQLPIKSREIFFRPVKSANGDRVINWTCAPHSAISALAPQFCLDTRP